MSLKQNVAHGFDRLIAIIWIIFGLVSTRVGIIRMPTSTKTDSWVATVTFVLLVSKNTNACFGIIVAGTNSIESFHVTVELQEGLWTNQTLPSVTTQRGGTVLPVSDQWVQRVGMLADDNKLDLVADLHTKTDLGEGCVPVRRQLRLLMIKPSLAPWMVKVDFVAPEVGIVTKGCLLRTKMKRVWPAGQLYGGQLFKIQIVEKNIFEKLFILEFKAGFHWRRSQGQSGVGVVRELMT